MERSIYKIYFEYYIVLKKESINEAPFFVNNNYNIKVRT